MRKGILIAALLLAGCSDPDVAAVRLLDVVGDPDSVQVRNMKQPLSPFRCGETKFVAVGGLGWTGWLPFTVRDGRASLLSSDAWEMEYCK